MLHIRKIEEQSARTPIRESANRPITVKQLYDALGKIVKAGGGGKSVYVMTDEEGNDYRAMWLLPTTNPQEIEDMMQYSCSGMSNCYDDVNNVILMG